MGLLDSVLGGPLGGALGNMLGGAAGGAGGGAGGAPGGEMLMQIIASLLKGQQGGGAGGGGGLGGLLQQLQQAGLGDAVQSWVGSGQNQPVSGEQLQAALGGDQISALAQQAGLPVGEMAGQLAHWLPQVVDKLTPNGELPAGGGDLGSALGGLLGGFLKG